MDSASYKVKGAASVKVAGDKIVYGTDLHSGIIVTGSTNAALCTIKSKWGAAPLMQHNALYAPSSYGKSLMCYGRK